LIPQTNMASVVSTGIKTEKIENVNQKETVLDEENIIYEAPKNEGIFSRAWQFLTSMLR
jgi:hypothetical protein